MGTVSAICNRQQRIVCWVIFCVIILSAIGCATMPTGPVREYPSTIGEKAALTAVSMIGRPYKYKGDSPAGFDCSGLVQYSYQSAGLDVPHGTKALRNRTRAISRNLQTGDLLFFTERGKKYSHVGIYLENDTFVHAPGTGGKVRKDSLQDPYWKDHFIDARSFL
jgi:murein DD-endopeptidase